MPAWDCRCLRADADWRADLDGMDADRFDSFSDEELRLIAALVAGAE